jgi:hypothetical protein
VSLRGKQVGNPTAGRSFLSPAIFFSGKSPLSPGRVMHAGKSSGPPRTRSIVQNGSTRGTQIILSSRIEKGIVAGNNPPARRSGLMAAAQDSGSPVPLYLLPLALSEEIRKHGDMIAEVRIRRTAGHTYILRVRHRKRGGRHE